jgi:3-hydroxyacyl-CoA dehydrogenase
MKVAVIGAGVMGPGITQTFLMGGHDATLIDIVPEALEKGVKEIQQCLDLMVEMEIIEDAAEALSRLSSASSLQAAADADLVVEVVPERPDIKESVYKELDAVCKPDALFVSNTSTFPIGIMFPDIRPGNLFVCHFFNPPAINPLVEIVHGEETDTDRVQWLREILEGCGKKPIVLSEYILGFFMNRIQTAMSREALYLLDRGIISADDMNTRKRTGSFKSARRSRVP